MDRKHTPLHVVCAMLGGACIVVDLGSNIEYMHEGTRTLFDSSIAAVVAVGVATAFALTAAIRAFRQWHVVTASLLLVGYALGASFSLTATLDRVSSQRDARLAQIEVVDKDMADLRELAKRVRYMAARECGSGRGPKCEAIESEVAIADRRIEQRRGELDSMGRRIAAITPLSANQASLFQPMLLPVALFLLGNWLLAFGLSGQMVPREFATVLNDQDRIEAKAIRFREQFIRHMGRRPRPRDYEQALRVSNNVARRLARQTA